MQHWHLVLTMHSNPTPENAHWWCQNDHLNGMEHISERRECIHVYGMHLKHLNPSHVWRSSCCLSNQSFPLKIFGVAIVIWTLLSTLFFEHELSCMGIKANPIHTASITSCFLLHRPVSVLKAIQNYKGTLHRWLKPDAIQLKLLCMLSDYIIL